LSFLHFFLIFSPDTRASLSLLRSLRGATPVLEVPDRPHTGGKGRIGISASSNQRLAEE
jgi:hypothetical protein